MVETRKYTIVAIPAGGHELDGAFQTEVEAVSPTEAACEALEEVDGFWDVVVSWGENGSWSCEGASGGRELIGRRTREASPSPSTCVQLIALAKLVDGHEKGVASSMAELLRTAAEELSTAQARARVLAHAYKHDNRPPDDVVDGALGYPVNPFR
jgi:hypothetical protein